MIYLDNAATTKPDEEVLAEAVKYYEENFWNPSALYAGGLAVKKRINEIREEILKGFPSSFETVFVSCGSEADNTAIFSFAKRGNAVTTSGEHSAVYESFCELKKRGVEPRFANLNDDGSVNVNDLLSRVDEKTTFVSVVHVNNETGAINDINAIAELVKKKNPSVIFHSDGVQAYGKIPYRLNDKIDAYSVSAHKIGGLKGVGVLFKKKNLAVTPLVFGGGQEGGRRSGTENVLGIIGFGRVAEKHNSAISENLEKTHKIKRVLTDNLDSRFIRIISGENSSPYILSFSAVGLRGEVIMHMLEEFGIIVGTGSACSSRQRHSRVLKNCGYGANVLDGALRISFSSETTESDALYAAEKINECVKKLKGVMDRNV